MRREDAYVRSRMQDIDVRLASAGLSAIRARGSRARELPGYRPQGFRAQAGESCQGPSKARDDAFGRRSHSLSAAFDIMQAASSGRLRLPVPRPLPSSRLGRAKRPHPADRISSGRVGDKMR